MVRYNKPTDGLSKDPTDTTGWPEFDISRKPIGMKGKAKSSIGPINSSTEKNACKHDYEFKYMKERVTEEGNIIRQDYYFCKHCLEEMVIESE